MSKPGLNICPKSVCMASWAQTLAKMCGAVDDNQTTGISSPQENECFGRCSRVGDTPIEFQSCLSIPAFSTLPQNWKYPEWGTMLVGLRLQWHHIHSCQTYAGGKALEDINSSPTGEIYT